MDKIPEEAYQKALGQFRLQLNGIMNCFKCYGLDNDVEGACEEIIKKFDELGIKLEKEICVNCQQLIKQSLMKTLDEYIELKIEDVNRRAKSTRDGEETFKLIGYAQCLREFQGFIYTFLGRF